MDNPAVRVVINNPAVGVVIMALLDQQGNGDEVAQALAIVGGAITAAASTSANQTPLWMAAGHEQAHSVILTVLRALGLGTVWAGFWASYDPRFRRAVGKKMLYAALVVLFVASVGLGVEVNLDI